MGGNNPSGKRKPTNYFIPPNFLCLLHRVAWFIGSELRVKQRSSPPFKAGMAHKHTAAPEVFTWIRFWSLSPAKLGIQSPAITETIKYMFSCFAMKCISITFLCIY